MQFVLKIASFFSNFFRKCNYIYGDKVYCLVCKEEFNEPRFLKDLFRTKKYHICNKCMVKYPFKIEHHIIPLENHNLKITSLFESNRSFNFEGYVYEFGTIYYWMLENNKNSIILFYDFFNITKEKLREFEYISTLLDKDIIVLTNIYHV